MLTNALPIPITQAGSLNIDLANDLGRIYQVNAVGSTGPRLFRLVKNNSGGTLSANQAVTTAYTAGGAPSWLVSTTTTVNDPAIAGIVPADIGTSTIAANAYFLVQVSGYATPLFAQSTITRTATNAGALGTATTAGYVQLLVGTATGTAAATLNDIGAQRIACLGYAVNSAVVTGPGGAGGAWLEGLI